MVFWSSGAQPKPVGPCGPGALRSSFAGVPSGTRQPERQPGLRLGASAGHENANGT